MSKLKVTQWEQRTVSDLMSIEIDTEVLAKCDPAFEGETVEELIDFLEELENIEAFTDNNEEVLGDFGTTLYEFVQFENPVTEYYDSSNKSSERSFEDGEDDPRAWEYFIDKNK